MTYLIMKLWLKLTDFAATSIGKKIDDAIFTAISIIILLIFIGPVFSVLAIPTLNTPDMELKNRKRPPRHEVCCDNCMNYDRDSGKCSQTKRAISDATHRSCMFFLKRLV